MKQFSVLIIFLLFVFDSYGQNLNNYIFSTGTTTYAVNGSVGRVQLHGQSVDDALSATQNIGFNFVYDGTTYTQFKASSNGWITFNTSITANYNSNNLTSPLARPIIAPLWDDLECDNSLGQSYCNYLLTGTSPNRVLTIEWNRHRWRYDSGDNVISFQCKLYETTNVIEFIYSQGTSAVVTASASIGLTGVSSSYISLNNVSSSPIISTSTENASINTRPATGQIYRFTPCTASTAPTSITGNSSVCNGGSTTLTSSGGSLGNDAVDVWYAGNCGAEVFSQPWIRQPYTTVQTTINSLNNGILNLTSTSVDPWIEMYNIGSFGSLSTNRFINIRYRVTGGTAGSAEIFFLSASNPSAAQARAVSGTLISDGQWRVLSIDMSTNASWTTIGNITGWRFDWSAASGVTMELDFIALGSQPVIGSGPSIIVSPTSATTYFTAKKGACGLTTCASQAISIGSAPTSVSAGVTTTPICAGANLALQGNATGATSWNWIGPNGFTSNLEDPTMTNASVAATGTYFLTASNTCGTGAGLFDDFNDGNYSSPTVWLDQTNSVSAASNFLQGDNTLTDERISTTSTQAYGSWQFDFSLVATGNSADVVRFHLLSSTAALNNSSGYFVRASGNGTNGIQLFRFDSGNPVALGSANYTPSTTSRTIRVTRSNDNTFRLYLDGVLLITTAADATYTTTSNAGFWISGNAATVNHSVDNVICSDRRVDATVNACAAPTITSISPTNACFNSGAAITINGTNLLNGTVTVNGVSATVTTNTANQLQVTLPSTATGTGSIVVTTATSPPASIGFTVNPLATAGTIQNTNNVQIANYSAISICAGTSITANNLVSPTNGGSGTLSVVWYCGELLSGTPGSGGSYGNWVRSTTASTALLAATGTNVTSLTNYNPQLDFPGKTNFLIIRRAFTDNCTEGVGGWIDQAFYLDLLTLPQGSFTGNSICSGSNAQLTFTSTAGTGPFNIVYNTGSQNPVNSGVAFNAAPLNPTTTTNYSLTSVTDANSCVRSSGFTQSTATVNVTATPLAPGSITTSNISCSSLTLNWAAAANADGYEMQVSTVSNFATTISGLNCGGVACDGSGNLGNVTTASITGLAANTQYWIRVRARNGAAPCRGAWANLNTTSVTTASQPVAPVLSLSANTICSGGTVSATLTTAGSGGFNCSATYEVNTSGTWIAYTLGTNVTAGTTNVQFRATWGSCSGTGCNTATITYSVNVLSVITGASFTFTNPTTSGGSGILTVSGATGGSGSYQYSIDGTNYQSSASFTSGLPAAASGSVWVRNASAPQCPVNIGSYTIGNAPPCPIPAVPMVNNSGAICLNSPASLTASGLAPGSGGRSGVASATNCGAYTFNGSNQFLRATSSVGLPTGSIVTIEAWINPAAVQNDATYNGIVSYGARACTGTSVLFSIKNDLRLSMATWCNDFTPSTGPSLVPNTWSHVAMVINGTSVAFYINGALAQTGTITAPNITTSASNAFNIGCTDNPGRHFNGSIDNVRIWSTARTQTQIQTDMYRETPSVATGLTALYTFNGTLAGSSPGTYTTTLTNNNSASPIIPSYYTYTWNGTPSGFNPTASTSEVQSTPNISTLGSYNFNVTATANNCSGSVSSNTTVPVTLCYCASNATNSDDSRINNVTFNTINQTSPNTCQTYTDYTAVSTTVAAGTNYSLSFTLGTCGGNFNKIGAAYIDWNIDGDFLDAGELVTVSPTINGTATHTANITIPNTASTGNTRLRVVCIEGSSTPPSCGTYSYGETEDYTINIIRPDYLATWGTLNFGSANWCAGETRNVTVTVTNSGAVTWTNPAIRIGYKWTADPWFDSYGNIYFDASVTPGASTTKTFSITAPATLGNNNLTFNIVREGVCWFSDNANGCGPGNTQLVSSVISIQPVPLANAGQDKLLPCNGGTILDGSSNNETLFSEDFGNGIPQELTNTTSNWRIFYRVGSHPANRTRWWIHNNTTSYPCLVSGSALLMQDPIIANQCDYAWDDGTMDEVAYNVNPVDGRLYTAINLAFDYKVTGERSGTTVYDYFQVVYSTDNGATWISLNTGNNGSGYSFTSNNGVNNGFFSLATTPASPNIAPALGRHNVDLSFLAGQTFLIGFRWYNDGATGNYNNFFVDNIAVTGSASYSWTPTVGVTGNLTKTPTVTLPSTYTVVVTAGNGCTATDQVVVNNTTLPAVPNITNTAPACPNQTINLSAHGLAPGGKVINLTGTNTINPGVNPSISNNFTIEFWVNPSKTRVTSTDVNTGVSTNTASNTDQSFAIYPDQRGAIAAGAGISVGTNGISVFEHGDGYLPSTLVYDATISGWTHVAVVYTNRIPSLYVNGVLVKTGVISGRATVHPSLGSGLAYGFFNGSIDNLRVWSTSRTASEINANMFLEVPSTTPAYLFSFDNSNCIADIGGVTNSASGVTYPDANYYTYTWSGSAGLPSPVANTNEIRTTPQLAPAIYNYTVTASSGACNGTPANTQAEVKTNNQTASSWIGSSTGTTPTDWFDAKNWSNCVPGNQTVVTIPRNMPSYPVITNTSTFDTANPKGRAKAKKVTLDTSGSGTQPTLNINTSSELKVNE